VITGGNTTLIKRKDDDVIPLTTTPGHFQIDETHSLTFRVAGHTLTMFVDGKEVAEAVDDEYPSGAAGFVVDEGAILCDGFTVKKL
jgi:hypothetical protein